MAAHLINHFRQLTTVSDELEQAILSQITHLEIKKGAHLHKAGRVCKHSYWIETGLLRTYYLKDGKEITDVFAAQGEWVTATHSFMTRQIDQYYLQTLENSVVYAMSYDHLMDLFDNFSEMERFGRITMSLNYMRLANKLESYQFSTAREKYDHFCENYKSILHRLPLGMVASYLGITQETLSRIRKQPTF